MPKPDYDTTLARIAGNIASGLQSRYLLSEGLMPDRDCLAAECVALARAIVTEVKRTELLNENAKLPARGTEG